MDKFIRPAKPGLIVRDPVTMTPLSVEGEYKTFIGPQGRYWRRKVKQGDCEIIEPEAKTKKKK